MTRLQLWRQLLRRLRWDLLDPRERIYYGYWLIWQLPGKAAAALRGRYLNRYVRRAGADLQVQPGCRFRSIEHMEVGDQVSIGPDNFFQAIGGLTIGNNVVTGPGVKIWSANHNYNDPDTPVSAQGGTSKPIVIGDDVTIEANAFVLPGALIGRGCIVRSGAVVGGKPYREDSIIGGNPARVLGSCRSEPRCPQET